MRVIEPLTRGSFFTPDIRTRPDLTASAVAVREFSVTLPIPPDKLVQLLAAGFDAKGQSLSWRNPFRGFVLAGRFVIAAEIPVTLRRLNGILAFGNVVPDADGCLVTVRIEPRNNLLSSDRASILSLGLSITTTLATAAVAGWFLVALETRPPLGLAVFPFLALVFGGIWHSRPATLCTLLDEGETEVRKWLQRALEAPGEKNRSSTKR